jgi:REP element-mobilizing transposase RayT
MVGDPPLAYFISFRCYGSWLHGDERGSTDRLHNQYGSLFLPPDEDWLRQDERRLKQSPVNLTGGQRNLVERAIRETCGIRKWCLLAINVRTNHVHVVLSCNGTRPELALNALKSNATRTLRQVGCWTSPHSPWSDHGSERYLWTELSVQRAIEYVTNCQDGMP